MNGEIQVDDAVLIHAVQERPEIWNASYNYTERMKLRLWKDIVQKLVPSSSDLEEDEKTALEMKFRKKWIALRDGYIDETKRRLSRGYKKGHSKKSLCPNYQLLKFLYPCLHSNEYRYYHSEQEIPKHLKHRHNIHITLNQRLLYSDVISAYLDSKLIAQRAYGIVPTKEDFLSDEHTFEVLLKGKKLEPEDPAEQKKILTKMITEFLEESEKIKKEEEEKERRKKKE